MWTVSRAAQWKDGFVDHLLPDHRDHRKRPPAARPRPHRSQQQGDRRGQQRGVWPPDRGQHPGRGGAAALPRQRRLARVHGRRRAGHRRRACLVPGEGHPAGRRRQPGPDGAHLQRDHAAVRSHWASTDPEEGRSRGLAEGTSLSLHGNIRVDAFDRFVNQRGPCGIADGDRGLQVPRSARGAAASKGVFNLFNPGGKGKEGLKPSSMYDRLVVRATAASPTDPAGHQGRADGRASMPGTTPPRSTRASTKDTDARGQRPRQGAGRPASSGSMTSAACCAR